MMRETPTISTSTYAAALGAAGGAANLNALVGGGGGTATEWTPQTFIAKTELYDRDALALKLDLQRRLAAGNQAQIPNQYQEKQMADTTRLVKVFIVDPNQSLSLESRLLYSGDEKLTDLTDQELFFEIDINGLLAKHNDIRTKTEDKRANKDKPVFLEPARVRDLRMQVVVLAQF